MAPQDGYSEGAADTVPVADGEATGSDSWQACLRQGYWNRQDGLGWMPYFVGSLKSFNKRTGYGFIECEQTYNIWKTDVYIHKNMIPTPWKIGQFVEFAAVQNPKGQPQAQDVMWMPIDVVPPKPKGEGDVDKKGDDAAPVPKILMHIGTLKSYNTSQGYGFLSSDPVFSKHHCDVYLDRSQLPQNVPWAMGQVVEFELVYNRKGQPQARNCNWDPVPSMNLPSTNPSGQNKFLNNMTMRNIDNILSPFRDGDRGPALQAALEAQENSQTVDYLSFALDHFGKPSASVIQDLAESPGYAGQLPLLLIIRLSAMLKEGQVAVPRTPSALSWCEATISIVAKTKPFSTNMTFEQLIDLVIDNFEAAKALQSVAAVIYPSIVEKLLSQLQEIKQTFSS
eukprot:TRINITY_DN102374_c0_g1_i1.p1 TRINITY_DN102374_c0_g1~~TRINITY_DN102374_c0_g1_i1.p1  ORF type:complete len:395 (-),score=75.55 TRINITY_DN102374_c0_g1_i1:152-1336(-)